jgi:hypothetical protein
MVSSKMEGPKTQRNDVIVLLYGAGHSLVYIAKKMALTVERVRRILLNSGVALRPVGRPKKKACR